jgi:hypothetical protein
MGDKTPVAVGAQDVVRRERHLRGVELFVVQHAPEGLARAQRQETELDAFDRDAAVDQGLGAVVAAARQSEPGARHDSKISAFADDR